MKALGSRQILRAVDKASNPQEIEEALSQVTWKEYRTIADDLEAQEHERGATILADLVQCEPDNLDDFRNEWLSARGEVISDRELLLLRDEVRALWKDAANGKAPDKERLERWWESKKLDAKLAWIQPALTFRILPFRHIRGRVALALAVWWEKLRECQNCHSLYVARRGDSKYCLEEGCKRYGAAQRAKRHYYKGAEQNG